jgi:hypothetical protein
MARLDKIGTVATCVYHNGDFTCVKYHYTDVVKFNWDKIILNSNGWQTQTTKTRMNQASNQFGLNFQVYQKNWDWFIDYNGQTVEFYDGIELVRSH